MENLIKQLDNNTINKIAAGEVIESPRSIIKELVENSIDAKSDEIIIEIKNGGKSFIRISDNGVGIEKDQIENAFKRHFTSKINRAEDLDSLHTLGFRGEALASIAAVAKVEVITRTKNEDYGTKLVIEGGQIVTKEDIGCPIGTTFVVTDLFYNVPARLKFLKSDVSESSKISEIVICLALSTDNVSFKYINNNKVIYKTPKSTNMLNILSTLYEKDLVNSLIEVNYESEYIKVKGFTTNLNYYRGNRKNQLFFVNGRYVKHNRANFFIEAAYNTLLPKDKHPACFLKITVNANAIDVNVHPAKTEIRIKEEELFLKELKSAIYKALKNINLVKEVKKDDIVKVNFNTNSKNNKNISIDDIFNLQSNDEKDNISNIFEDKSKQELKSDILYNIPNSKPEETEKPVENKHIVAKDIFDTEDKNISSYNDIFSDKSLNEFNDLTKKLVKYDVIDNSISTKNDTIYNTEKIAETSELSKNSSSDLSKDSYNYTMNDSYKNNKTANNDINLHENVNSNETTKNNEELITQEKQNKQDETQDIVIEQKDNDIDLEETQSLNNINKNILANLRYIGMLFNTYILCESKETSEFYMIDQHAAHERINYERFLEQFENKKIYKQELLIPEVINLSHDDYNYTITNKEVFDSLGLNIESFGINDIIINSIPLIFIDVNVKQLFYNILDTMKENKKGNKFNFEMSKIIKNACVNSVKAGDMLHELEIKKLINDLSNTRSPYTCPHGRPTIIKMTKYEVERMFERIQL